MVSCGLLADFLRTDSLQRRLRILMKLASRERTGGTGAGTVVCSANVTCRRRHHDPWTSFAQKSLTYRGRRLAQDRTNPKKIPRPTASERRNKVGVRGHAVTLRNELWSRAFHCNDLCMESLEEPMLSVVELAEKLGCSADYVRSRVRKGAWPHHRFGPRMIKFSAANVATILNAAKRVPAQNSTLEQVAAAQKDLEARKIMGATGLSITRRERKLRSLRIQALLEQQEIDEESHGD